MIIINGPLPPTAPDLKHLFDPILGDKKGFRYTVDVKYVSEAEITSLNKQYRQNFTPTDVLSFPLYNSMAELPAADAMIGDLAICPEQTGSEHLDLINCYLHGILHLLGYDHEKDSKEWRDAERKITHHS